MKKVKVYIERGDDGTFGAYMPERKDLNFTLIGDGDTIEEAVADFKASYEEIKQMYAESGEPFEELQFEFCYDVPSFLSYYQGQLTLAGLQRITGVAQGQLSHYVTGRRRPSAKTIAKIESSLHKFGNELAHIRFM